MTYDALKYVILYYYKLVTATLILLLLYSTRKCANYKFYLDYNYSFYN